MAKRLAVDGDNVVRVRAREELVRQVSIAHRGDYEVLLRKGVVLAVDGGNDCFYLVEPVGALSFLRKGCVKVLGLAPKNVIVEADKKNGFVRRA